MASIVQEEMYSMKNYDIPYKDASKLYTIICYNSFSGFISRAIALRLVREHPKEVPWTTIMFSWLDEIVIDPLVSKAEVEGMETDGSEETKHILYYYPSLLPLFRADHELNWSASMDHMTSELRQDFSEFYEDYYPTMEEKALLGHYDCDHSALSKREFSYVLNPFFFGQLLPVPECYSMDSKDSEAALGTLIRIRDSGISQERFYFYIKHDWEDRIFYRVLEEFLKFLWSMVWHKTIGEILCLYPKFEPYGKLIVKHGLYARIATSKRLMCHLLNHIPSYDSAKDLEEFDQALSDLAAYEQKLIKYNKKKASKIINKASRDRWNNKIKNCIPEEMYSYPTCELVFHIIKDELHCYTRLDWKLVLEKGLTDVHNKLSRISSPITTEVYEAVGFNILKLFKDYADPEYHSERINDARTHLSERYKETYTFGPREIFQYLDLYLPEP